MPRRAQKNGRRRKEGAVRPGPREILLHFHLFKNAGSTLDAALRHHFGPAWAEVEGEDPNRPLDWMNAFRVLATDPTISVISSHTARFPAPEHPDFRFIPVFLIRHPIDRLAAIYFFEKNNPAAPPNEAARVARTGTLADFMHFALAERADVPSAVCDAQTSWLARGGSYPAPPAREDLARAKSVVASALVPGVVEKMDLYLSSLERALAANFPQVDLAAPDRNRNPDRPATLLGRLREVRRLLPAALWREIQARNQLDLELWRFTSRLAQARFRQMPDSSERLMHFRRRKAAAAAAAANEGGADATADLPWTGERLVAAARGDFVAEHLHRYALAAEFAGGCDVLDVACGEGYGAAHLARVAARVTGVDSDAPTIAHAAGKYRAKNLRFLVGRAEKLPLDDHSVDLVVSFETLEHLEDHEAMLGEIKRVLRPGGRLLISTPDVKAYRMVSGKTNPFHVRELNRRKFRRLLDTHFSHTALGLQKSLSGSWVVPAEGQPAALAEYSGDMRRITGERAGADAPYLVALASDAPVAPLASSFFNSPQLLASAVRAMESELDNSRKEHSRLEAEIADRTSWVAAVEADLQKSNEEVRRLQTETVELTNWAKSLDADLRQARAVIAKRTKKVEKLTAWAKSLEKDLRSAQASFEKLAGEYDERTAWAKSLEADLAESRTIAEQKDRLVEERSAWGRELERELATTRSEVDRLQNEHQSAVAWGVALERDLQAARSEVGRLQQEHGTAVAWGRSLEAELLDRRAEVGRLQQEHGTAVAWGQSLEAELLDRRAEVGRLQQEHEAGVAWSKSLESELRSMEREVGRLQDEHRQAVAWGRSLEAELDTSRREYGRLEAEFADRTAWAKSLDAELLDTKADRDRIANEREVFGRQLAEIAAACERLSAMVPGKPGTPAATMVDLGLRTIADLQRNAALKDAEHRSARASNREISRQNEGADGEARRLGHSLVQAQVHIDNLLRRVDQLEQYAQGENEARLAEEAARREKDRELVLRLIELQEAQMKLKNLERHPAFRLLGRWWTV